MPQVGQAINPSDIAGPAAPSAPVQTGGKVGQAIDPSQIVGGVGRALTSEIPKPSPGEIQAEGVVGNKLLDLINRTSMAGLATRQRGIGAGLQTLLHSEDPAQYQKDTEARAAAEAHMTPEEYAKQPGWMKTIHEGSVQVQWDPTTYLGGAGLAKRGMEAMGEHTLPIIMRSWAKAMMNPSTSEAATHIGNLAARAHGAFVAGGKSAAEAERVEALARGRAGVRNIQRLYSLRGSNAHMSADLEQALNKGFDRALHGVSNDDRLTIFRAIHNGTIQKLPQPLRDAALQVQTYDRAQAWILGSKAMHAKLTKLGFQLPADLDRFMVDIHGNPITPRGTVRAHQFMEKHVPAPHEFTDAEKQQMEMRAMTTRGKRTIEKRNKQFLERKGQAFRITDPEYTEDLFRQSFYKTARSAANTDLQNTLSRMFGKPYTISAKIPAGDEEIRQAIEAYNKGARLSKPLTPTLTYPTRRAAQAVKAAGGASHVPFHELGQSVRDIITDPFAKTRTVQRKGFRYSTVPEHVKSYFTSAGREVDPSTQWALDKLRGVSDISRSALFTTPFQHSSRIASLLLLHDPTAIGEALSNYARTGFGFASDVRKSKVLGAAQRAGAVGAPNVEQSKLISLLNKGGKTGKLAAKYFEGVGKMLWGWDDAAKAALFKRYMAHYEDPLVAAYHAQRDLVNYGFPSRFIEGARTISSFPTWRARMPHAVARAFARSPQNAAALAKFAPELFGAETPAEGGKKHRLGSSAGSEISGGPIKYAMGSLNPTTRLGLYALLRTVGRESPEQASGAVFYGEPAGKYLGESLPGVGQAAELSGQGLFQSTPEEGLLNLLTGYETIYPSAKKRTTRHLRSRRGKVPLPWWEAP